MDENEDKYCPGKNRFKRPLIKMASQGSRRQPHIETIARFFPSSDRTEGKTEKTGYYENSF
jgi:hypothetical protein